MEHVPFRFGTIAEGNDFTNRIQEVKHLEKNFKNGINTILISPRRWGKSSLIKHVSNQKEFGTIRFCFLDLFNTRTEEEFYELFSKEIIKASDVNWKSRIKEIGKFFKQFLPVFNISPDPNTDVSISLNWEDVKKYPTDILNLGEKICKSQNIKMIVCIDEFQNIEFYEEPLAFQKKLRANWQHHRHVTYCVFGSKRHMMINIFDNSSMPFYKFGDIMLLEKISINDWIVFIQKRFKDTSKVISKELAKEIAGLMENHSYYVQQLAQQVWFLTNETCAPETIDLAVQYLLQQHHFLFQKEADQLTTSQINFLKALLENVEKFTSVSTLKNFKLGTAGNVKRIREALEDKEIIDTTVKKPEFQDPLFKLWLKQTFFELRVSNINDYMNEKQMKIVNIICEAINQRKLVQFFYENIDEKRKEWRTVEPYLVGIRKHNNNVFFTGWFLPTKEQLQDREEGQKQYLIDKIDFNSLKILHKSFNRIKIPPERITQTPTIDVICKIEINE